MGALDALTGLVVGASRFGDHLLKQKVRGIVVAALAFLCGACLFHATRREPRHAAPPPPVAAPPCETAAPPAKTAAEPADDYDEEVWGTPELEAWKNGHSGAPLPLGDAFGRDRARVSESKVVLLPSGRTLVAEDTQLYMFDANRRALWKYEMPAEAIGLAHVEATGVVCGTAQDNNMFILDAATGGVLVSNSRQGRGGYGDVLKYGSDTCLIADALGGYNADYRGGKPMFDGVTAWRGARMLWHAHAPPDAELQVAGSKIYAVTKTRTQILVKEIKPPEAER